MKLYSYHHNGRQHAGVLHGQQLIDLRPVTGHTDLTDFLRDGRSWSGNIAEYLSQTPEGIRPDQVTLLPPLRPEKIICSGLNYRSHILENPKGRLLTVPRFFFKLPHTLIGPGEPIRHPGQAFQVDYEVELAVVFGKTAYRVSPEEAMEYVFGYTILHDVSARYIQFRENNEMLGKNFETFCPIGPCLVTKDELPEPEKCRLRTFLNGVLVQDGTNEDWCFSLPRLISFVTMAFRMEAGDILSAGTPAGTGFFRQPQVFLQPGDECTLEIDGIGRLSNPIIHDPYPYPI